MSLFLFLPLSSSVSYPGLAVSLARPVPRAGPGRAGHGRAAAGRSAPGQPRGGLHRYASRPLPGTSAQPQAFGRRGVAWRGLGRWLERGRVKRRTPGTSRGIVIISGEESKELEFHGAVPPPPPTAPTSLLASTSVMRRRRRSAVESTKSLILLKLPPSRLATLPIGRRETEGRGVEGGAYQNKVTGRGSTL